MRCGESSGNTPAVWSLLRCCFSSKGNRAEPLLLRSSLSPALGALRGLQGGPNCPPPQQRGRGCVRPPPSEQQSADTPSQTRVSAFPPRGATASPPPGRSRRISGIPRTPFCSFLLIAGTGGARGAPWGCGASCGPGCAGPALSLFNLGAGGRGSGRRRAARRVRAPAKPQLAEPTGREQADSFVGRPAPISGLTVTPAV